LLTAPDVSAPGGVAGTVLVDPNSIFIVNVAPATEDPLLPTILFADPPVGAQVSVQALESATGNLILEANSSIFWISAPADNSIDLQPGVSIRLTSGGSINANPGLAIRTTNGDITLQATNSIQAPGLFATNGVVLVESQTGQITVAGSINADRVTLNAAERIQTGTHTINAGAGGVSITSRTLLGNSGPGFDFESQINSSGPATFTFTGPDDPFAGATAKVRGSLTGGVSVNAPSGSTILINGAPPGGGGTVPPVPPPIFPNDQVPTGPEGFERPFLLQATAQQIVDLGNLETYFDLNPGSMDRLPVRNYSLLGPSPIPLYTLDLVGMQYSDDKEGFWRRYLDRFIIWEDEADEAQISPGSRPD
jgi:hypothetical protein